MELYIAYKVKLLNLEYGLISKSIKYFIYLTKLIL